MRISLQGLILSSLALAFPSDGIPQEMDAILDAFSERLRLASEDKRTRASISGLLDLEGYTFDGSPPGLLDTGENSLLQPRATLFVDLQSGPAVYGFAQLRVDRGFDPADQPLETRLDEFAVRFTPWKDGRFSLQAGQFATLVGRWVTRHLSWQNPFVTAPLLYENPTRLSDRRPPPSPYYLTLPLSRPGYYYSPVIWGPSYASGLAASGKWRTWEWAAEVKNASLMSRPAIWPLDERGFDEPTFSGRIAWRPDLRWTFGLSASRGSYAGSEAYFDNPGAYRQDLILLDISYEYRHLQIWAEFARSSFSVPGLYRDLWTRVWFVEARYKLRPRLSFALRWNQQRFSEVHAYGDSIGTWGVDRRRLDTALTWRFNAHSQIQMQVDHYWNEGSTMDRFVFSIRLTLRF